MIRSDGFSFDANNFVRKLLATTRFSHVCRLIQTEVVLTEPTLLEIASSQ